MSTKLVMQFTRLHVAINFSQAVEGLVVLESQDGNYVVTEGCHVKTLKKQGYRDVREEK